jgi:hypothetical protein
MTSGWIIAKDRFSINFLNPYLPVSFAESMVEEDREEKEDSLRVLVFTGCKLDMRKSLVQFDVSIEIIWVKTFFPPKDLYSGIFYRFDEFDSVWLLVRHVHVQVGRSRHTTSRDM